MIVLIFFFFFFNDTATTEIYTLSLHDALPIFIVRGQLDTGVEDLNLFEWFDVVVNDHAFGTDNGHFADLADRKSTRLNSSHLVISYAVFCLKKKKPRVQVKVRVCIYAEAR